MFNLDGFSRNIDITLFIYSFLNLRTKILLSDIKRENEL